RAFALVGALSIIRFRNAVKESRDVAFVFLAMGIGMACGTKFYQLAIASAFVISGFILLLFRLNLFTWEFKERILRVCVPVDADHESILAPLFRKFTDESALVAMETVKVGELQELVYTVRLKRKVSEQNLLEEVRKVNQGNKVALVTGFQEVDL
ncbi:MAG: DUF4956 domain-containing protein, partial [Planctomycetota bacterium]